jgi:dihydroorotate dehydrogenase
MAYRLLRPLIFRLDAEKAHRATIAGLKLLPERTPPPFDPVLGVELAGLRLPSPVGLAAGFDKDAEVPGAMLGLGFGFVEVGTLTPRPQSGNPKPRLFRLAEDRAVINRMGFNNGGQAAALERLRLRKRQGIVGVNIGANKDSADRIADYATGVRTMSPVADYLTINISSPNTPGLRNLQAGGELVELLAAVREARTPGIPIFLKVAPDLAPSDPVSIVRAVIDAGIDGIIIGNTTVSRPASLSSAKASESGGLSGAPLAPLALEQLRQFHTVTGGEVPLIAAGGISSGMDAWWRIRAGASLVQLYSIMVYEGPSIANRIAAGLMRILEQSPFSTIAEAIGSD